jgi:hypothetical protein
MYKYRRSVIKDYRFCVSYAAYLLGDRSIREITHVWTYLNPDIQKGSFTPEEDLILLTQANQSVVICWSTLAASHLPDRSAVQCRQRYFQLIKPRSTETTTRKVRLKKEHLLFYEILILNNQRGIKNFYRVDKAFSNYLRQNPE